MSKNKLNPSDIREYILELEQREDLFSWRINGLQIWGVIRNPIYSRIKRKTGVSGDAHGEVPNNIKEYLKGGYLWSKNIFSKNPFYGDGQIITYGRQRRKLLEDGYWWDILFDPLYQNTDLDCLHLERPYKNEHKTPAKTRDIKYIDTIVYTATIVNKLNIVRPNFSEEDERTFRLINNDIEKEFGIRLDLRSLAKRKLITEKSTRPFYKLLLRNVEPELALMSRSYGREPFIRACKELNIPVVEFQHGVIHENHLGYNFPKDREPDLFPDYIFTYGEYWSRSVDFPIESDHVISVGYPYLEQRRKQFSNLSSDDQIIFISQGTIGKQLSKFAIELNQHPDMSHDIIYKLHPGEYGRWKKEYPWLQRAEFEIVGESGPPLYKLFAESSAQVGVGSTAVYEGLAFDLETYVYDCTGSSILYPLVEDGSAQLVSSPEEILSTLGTTAISFNKDYYFAENAIDNILEEIKKLVAKSE